MTMQFLSATTDAQGIHYSVWLDTTKTDAGGQPDSTYVKSYDWAPCPMDPDGTPNWEGGASAYEQMTLDEVKLLAQADLHAMTAPTPAPTNLSVHGTTF